MIEGGPVEIIMSHGQNNWPFIINVGNSIIGVTVLAMPFCFKMCGIVLGSLLLFFSTWLTVKSCTLLMKAGVTSRRRSYSLLAYYTHGATGKLVVELGMIGLQLGTLVAQVVIIGDLGPAIVSKFTGFPNTDRLRTGLIVFLCLFVGLPLGLLKDVRTLSKTSAMCILFYGFFTVYVVMLSIPKLVTTNWYNHVNFWRKEGFFQCLPIFSFAFGCQTQLFIVYEALTEPSLKRINSIVSSAVHMCTASYLLVGFFGYIAFCDVTDLSGDIINHFSENTLSDVIKLFFVFSIAVSIPLIVFPCRASLYTLLFPQKPKDDMPGNWKIPEFHFKVITAFIIIGSMIIGILVPNVEFVLGLNGATMGTLICYIFPALFFLTVMSDTSEGKASGRMVLVFGFTILVLSTYTILATVKPAEPATSPPVGLDSNLDQMAGRNGPTPDSSKLELPVADPNKAREVKKPPDKNDSREDRHEPPNPQPPDEHAIKPADDARGKSSRADEHKDTKDAAVQAIVEKLQDKDKDLDKDKKTKNGDESVKIKEKLKEKEEESKAKLEVEEKVRQEVEEKWKEKDRKQEEILEKLEQQKEEQQKIIEEQKHILEELKHHQEQQHKDDTVKDQPPAVLADKVPVGDQQPAVAHQEQVAAQQQFVQNNAGQQIGQQQIGQQPVAQQQFGQQPVAQQQFAQQQQPVAQQQQPAAQQQFGQQAAQQNVGQQMVQQQIGQQILNNPAGNQQIQQAAFGQPLGQQQLPGNQPVLVQQQPGGYQAAQQGGGGLGMQQPVAGGLIQQPVAEAGNLQGGGQQQLQGHQVVNLVEERNAQANIDRQQHVAVDQNDIGNVLVNHGNVQGNVANNQAGLGNKQNDPDLKVNEMIADPGKDANIGVNENAGNNVVNQVLGNQDNIEDVAKVKDNDIKPIVRGDDMVGNDVDLKRRLKRDVAGGMGIGETQDDRKETVNSNNEIGKIVDENMEMKKQKSENKNMAHGGVGKAESNGVNRDLKQIDIADEKNSLFDVAENEQLKFQPAIQETNDDSVQDIDRYINELGNKINNDLSQRNGGLDIEKDFERKR